MRYKFKIDLRALKRKAPPRESVHLSQQEEEPEELLPLPESGDPRIKAYNASLNWARSHRPGKFVTGGLEYSVHEGEDGSFHVMTRPRDKKQERVSEVIIFPNGSLLSRNLVFQQGQPRDLHEFFLHGLELPDVEDEALAELAGYELQATFYRREGDRLAGVDRWQRYWDSATESAVHHEINS